MPIEWINGTGGNSWYPLTPTTATTAVTPTMWINTTSTTATTSTMPVTAWAYWYDDHMIGSTGSTITWTQPVRTWINPVRRISPARLYIARRSYQQAIADDLHDFYAAEQRRQQRELKKQHDDAASARSLELLLAHLSPAQRETFERNKWFVVEGGKSGQRYRIRHTGHMVANIDVLAGGAVEHRLCGHCDLSEVPLFDQLLAQKMMLEYDEERFLKLANRHARAA